MKLLERFGTWLKQRARMKPPGESSFVSEQRKPLPRSFACGGGSHCDDRCTQLKELTGGRHGGGFDELYSTSDYSKAQRRESPRSDAVNGASSPASAPAPRVASRSPDP